MAVGRTPGETSDYKGYDTVMHAPDIPSPSVFIADKDYDSDAIRNAAAARGGTDVILHRKNSRELQSVDGFVYALRNLIERCFNKLKNARRAATRFDKTKESYLAFIESVSARIWFRRLST